MGLKMIAFQNGRKLVMSKYQREELKKREDEGGWRVRNWERGKEEEI